MLFCFWGLFNLGFEKFDFYLFSFEPACYLITGAVLASHCYCPCQVKSEYIYIYLYNPLYIKLCYFNVCTMYSLTMDVEGGSLKRGPIYLGHFGCSLTGHSVCLFEVVLKIYCVTLYRLWCWSVEVRHCITTRQYNGPEHGRHPSHAFTYFCFYFFLRSVSLPAVTLTTTVLLISFASFLCSRRVFMKCVWI